MLCFSQSCFEVFSPRGFEVFSPSQGADTKIIQNSVLSQRPSPLAGDEVLHSPGPPGWVKSTTNPSPLAGDEVLLPQPGGWKVNNSVKSVVKMCDTRRRRRSVCCCSCCCLGVAVTSYKTHAQSCKGIPIHMSLRLKPANTRHLKSFAKTERHQT